MKLPHSAVLLGLCTVLMFADLGAQADAQPTLATWPGFRGPAMTGVAAGVTPPSKWNDEENLAWRIALPGPGSSSPIVIGDRVYLTCYSGYGAQFKDAKIEELKHHLVCVDRTKGEIAWDVTVPGALPKAPRRIQVKEHGFASPTPVADDDTIYAYFGHAGVIAVDFDGKVRWRTSVGTPSPDAPKRTNEVVRKGKALDLHWGAAASPILYRDLVIVNASEESNSVRAFDRKTGALRWKRESANLEGCASSPIIAGTGDEAVVILVLGGAVWALDPASGAFRWRVKTGSAGGMSPTPISSDGVVYAFGGSGKSHALRLGTVSAGDAARTDPAPPAATRPQETPPEKEQPAVEGGDAKPKPDAAPDDPRIVWRSENLGIPSPILHDGQLILVRMRGVVIRLDAKSGKELSKGRLAGKTGGLYASPVIAAGRMYVASRNNGVFVYETDDEFTLVSKNTLKDDSQFNGTPAFVGNQIFLRSDSHLYCVASADG